MPPERPFQEAREQEFWKRTTWKRGGWLLQDYDAKSWIKSCGSWRTEAQTTRPYHTLEKLAELARVIRLRQNPLHVLRQNLRVDHAAKMEPEF